jgi:hypothetical protein
MNPPNIYYFLKNDFDAAVFHVIYIGHNYLYVLVSISDYYVLT